jgi:hypothetical protein
MPSLAVLWWARGYDDYNADPESWPEEYDEWDPARQTLYENGRLAAAHGKAYKLQRERSEG